MKQIFLTIILFTTILYASGQYQVDSMCGVKVTLDKSGKLLARYNPESPGAGYVKVVQLAIDFWKNCPIRDYIDLTDQTLIRILKQLFFAITTCP